MSVFDRFRKKSGEEIEKEVMEEKRVEEARIYKQEESEKSSGLISKITQSAKEIINFGKEKELAIEMSSIKSEEHALQELAYKLTLQLVEFWGIPSSLQVQAFVPKVKICDKDEYKKFIGKEDADIDKEVPIAEYLKFSWGNAHYVVINKKWFSNEFSSGLMHSIKPSLAEEICHFIQDAIEEKSGKPDIFVKEFFGAISRLYVAEQIPELFKGEYRNLFNNAIELSTKFENTKNAIRYFESMYQSNNPQFEAQNKVISEKISELKDVLDHLAYYPAVAYYYEIRKMSPQERYKLLNMNFTDLKNYIIGPQIRKLEEIRIKVMQRRQVKVEREKAINAYPESSHFFQGVDDEYRLENSDKKIDEIESREREIENLEARENEIDEMEKREDELEKKEEESEED
ncbi:hypothetical protein A3K64_02580 [Candidatus Micrarchaeota archaeon RBG_16_36_9]|nr:MAG: hypothetical protein A3K64_02580 [Candidatus Micrarchaeota archaeon RBG_16_36_9]